MRYVLTRNVTTSQKGYVLNHGDVVWQWICDNCPVSFHIPNVANECPHISMYAPRTRTEIVRSIVMNVAEENETKPIFAKRGNNYFWL